MTAVQLVDVSLRDGNQSLWSATGVDNRLVEKVSPDLGRAGYRCIELTNSTQMAMAVRTQSEDPWDRIRTARRLMPDATLGFLTTGKRFITFYRTPPAVFEFALTLLRRAGVTRLWVVDPMHDMDNVAEVAATAKRIGFDDVVAGLCYTVSPLHTDEYFSAQAARLAGNPDIDSVYLKDPGGVLTPDRLRQLQPVVQERLGDLAMDEIHSHATTGLAPQTLLTAVELGMTNLHCALPPLADGPSHSNAFQLVHNLHALGHTTGVDLDAMAGASAVLDRHATLRRLAKGTPAQYDVDYYRHTIPGGVQSTLRRQLREMGREDLYDQVIEESVAVREDLGWPIVMTPFAQYIVTQATLNIVAGGRYEVLADEIVDLLRGDFGALPGRVDQDLYDRAMDTQRAKTRPSYQEEVTVADLRARFGRDLSDEELLLRAVMPAEQVDRMTAARAGGGGIESVLRQFAETPRMRRMAVQLGDTHLRVERKTDV